MKKLIVAASALLICNLAEAQKTKQPAFTKLKSGLEYSIVKDVKGTKTANDGDFVIMHLQRKGNDTLQFDSRSMNNNEPVPYPIQPAAFSGDPVEVLKLLTAGDSVIIRIPIDSLRKAGMQMPEVAYKMLDMYVAVVDVKTKLEMDTENAKKAAAQIGVDDQLIQDYLKKNNIKATKTASGLYYSVTEPGSGEVIKAGQTAQVMYVGKLLNGSIFDANMGADAKHTDPLPVAVGQGRVIKGWDEGLALLKKGSKATFYIPSPLAYGAQSPSPAIPANSVLVFDVDIKDVQ
jgi:FKBP-type peptidyl-prolyl cis-trans isomerase FkpA